MTDTVDTVDTASGNTRIRSRAWCFTLNNPLEDDLAQLTQIFDADDAKYVCQTETGEEGTVHLQGVVYYKNARAFNSMKQIDNRIHWERCRDLKKSIKYCSKWETRTGPTVVKGFDVKIVKNPMEGKEFFDWQKEILDIINGPVDDRAIYWYWEPTGCAGKTTFCKYLCMNYDAIYVAGKSADVKYACMKMGRIPKIILFDIPRCKEGYVSYMALEEVKNGIFFSTKYEAAMMIDENPHVIVFANFEPDREHMSHDKWRIIEINGEELL